MNTYSKGSIYPAVISTVERYTPDGKYLDTSYALTLDGRTEEYDTYAQAEVVARALLKYAPARISWARLGRAS